MGNLAETAVWGKWLHDTGISQSMHYARWRVGRRDLEVDIVSLDSRTQKPRFAIEIKCSDAIGGQGKELRGLKELAERHELARFPLVTATRTHSEELELDGITIDFVPVAVHCYTIGRNLLRPKFGETDAAPH